MADISDIKPLQPVWPTRSSDKVEDRERQPSKREQEPKKNGERDDQKDRRHIDTYA